MTEYLTLEEVAERCRVGKRTVERWVADGELESLKFGRRRLVTPDAIERMQRRALKRGRVA